MYLVATPIGNLADVSLRALAVLRQADLLLAEDTRITRRLLDAHGIDRPVQAMHQHNEQALVARLVRRIQEESLAVALVSDAGTPLISDPGYPLTRALVRAGVPVRAVPGPSAVLAALASSGLATDRFAFEGFLPARAAARRERLAALAHEPRTLVLFEAPHRVRDCLADLAAAFGADRPVCVARELTKLHETHYRGTAAEVGAAVAADPNASRGEIVIVVAPPPAPSADDSRVRAVLVRLLPHVPLREAVEIAVELTDSNRNAVYALAVALKEAHTAAPPR